MTMVVKKNQQKTLESGHVSEKDSLFSKVLQNPHGKNPIRKDGGKPKY